MFGHGPPTAGTMVSPDKRERPAVRWWNNKERERHLSLSRGE